MGKSPPDKASVPDAVRTEIFNFWDAVFASDVQDPATQLEWVTLRASGYRAFVANLCLLQFAAVLYLFFDYFKLHPEDYHQLMKLLSLLLLPSTGLVLWCHTMVIRFFLFRARVRAKRR